MKIKVGSKAEAKTKTYGPHELGLQEGVYALASTSDGSGRRKHYRFICIKHPNPAHSPVVLFVQRMDDGDVADVTPLAPAAWAGDSFYLTDEKLEFRFN